MYSLWAPRSFPTHGQLREVYVTVRAKCRRRRSSLIITHVYKHTPMHLMRRTLVSFLYEHKTSILYLMGQRSLTGTLSSHLIGWPVKMTRCSPNRLHRYSGDVLFQTEECFGHTDSVKSIPACADTRSRWAASCRIFTPCPGNIVLTFQDRWRQPSGAVWNGGVSEIFRHTHARWIQGFEMATGSSSLHNHSHTLLQILSPSISII